MCVPLLLLILLELHLLQSQSKGIGTKMNDYIILISLININWHNCYERKKRPEKAIKTLNRLEIINGVPKMVHANIIH